MRQEVTERFYRFFTGQEVDCCPDIPMKHYQEYLEKKRKLIGRQ